MQFVDGNTFCCQPDRPGRGRPIRCYCPQFRPPAPRPTERKLRIQDRRCYPRDPTPVRVGDPDRKIQLLQEIEVLRRGMICLQHVARGTATATATIGEKQCGVFVGVATNDS